MANHRCALVTGGTFFFTVVTYRRKLIFDQLESRQTLHEIVQEVRRRHAFTVDAWVLLPDHLHCILTLPKESSDFPVRWGLIKSRFSKRMGSLFRVEKWINDSKLKHRDSIIWQGQFWEHHIRSDEEYQGYMDYIHYDPVKHGLVKRVLDWPYSTFHRYVNLGIYPAHWGCETVEASGYRFGE